MSMRAWLLKRMRRNHSDPCLYLFPFSIHSIIVRFTIALAVRRTRRFRGSGDLTKLTYRLVNLRRNENLEENFLLEINPRGQVPVLTCKSLASPLTDCLSICHWVCEQNPVLLPASRQATICRLLSQLHETLANNNPNPAVDDLLARNDITPARRYALEYKRDCQRKERERESTQNHNGMTAHTKAFLSEVAKQHHEFSDGGTWIFGDGTGPTVLDAHVVAFIARLIDINLVELVPPQLLPFVETIMALPEWEDAMKGRPTVWSASLGPIEKLQI
ncbi:hypothetical protein ARAM_002286 [Aspergillus rambellii]|uniref:GST N-terminal domain-containing protein n=1 Tax=Aspergillus rambellii TaxID=308745 RepID=A0A0F8XCY2_9EURO|nr:hypothetical protein ARAM_002286 [Aspergillus rambellii]